LVCALSAVTLAACGIGETVPGSGTIDGLDLGMELGLDLRELESAPVSPDAAVLARARELTGLNPPGPVHLYTGSTHLGNDDVDLRIVVVPLPDTGRLAVAVDSGGVVRATALWGDSMFDTDRDGAWETFCLQFKDRPQLLEAEDTLDPEGVTQYWLELQNDLSSEAAVVRALYRHRRLMSASGQLVRATMRRTARGGLPPLIWIARWKRNMQEVADLSDPLADVIGPEAAERHRELAEDAVQRLDKLAMAARTEEPRAVRKLVSGKFYRGACTACHTVTSERLGGEELYDGIRRRLPELGIRRDLCRVGFDLWAVPGYEEVSQQVAAAFKTAFVILGETPAE
jgi:hypothetical protein